MKTALVFHHNLRRFISGPGRRWSIVAGLLAWLVASQPGLLAADARTDERLRRGLKLYPEADTNRDGVLTEAEARAYLQKLKGGPAKAAAQKAGAPKTAGPAPTFADVKYGPHERNVLDFWQAQSDRPTPVVVFIHGGGFKAGDKSKVRTDPLLRQCLDAGVSFAAINYRFRPATPIQDILRDCARAIQFIRFQAREWNVDKTRVAAYGGSAGAGTSLWLAFHDDLADPQSSDPVLRESTRLVCAGANSVQFSYDLLQWEPLLGDAVHRFSDPDEGPMFYGFKTMEELQTEAAKRIRADCDMRGLITRDDPPVFLATTQPGGEITSRGHLLHHPKHALAIKERCDAAGVQAVAVLPGLGIRPGPGDPASLGEFLLRHLNGTPAGN
jgi:acetyl esterase/lipase